MCITESFVFLVDTGFLHVGQVDLELLTSGDSPPLPPKVLELQAGAIMPSPAVFQFRSLSTKSTWWLVWL